MKDTSLTSSEGMRNRAWDPSTGIKTADHHHAIWWRSSFEMPDEYSSDPFLIGPSQADDLGLLFAAIKETRPATVVEIGFFHGDSTRAILSAADRTSKIFSFDVSVNVQARARLEEAIANANRRGHHAAKWTIKQKNATALDSSDVSHRPVDFVFFDGPHRLELNKAIFRRLLPMLSPFALIAVHDTGYWSREWLRSTESGRKAIATWACGGGGCASARGTATGRQMLLHVNSAEERQFIAWVLKNGSGCPFNAVSFHSFNYLRNGITLLQRKHLNDNDWRRRR